ncbi:5'-nucleotidase, lipoprotein e(P4) family [Oceanibacterium hippocampi]|uniref:Lipoprotein E n=1 Tax=Oceanibacterium hippocampi TaxID=745714 RepID=A0A1Y5S2R3_9PROT|nr:HAD family acid phosphatase [Oceanibacterium hippocampi]SLN31004.1 Lipoprotein E precursor [Oceanibacterium hippocampi]
MRNFASILAAGALAATLLGPAPATALSQPEADDNLNATLWAQSAVEYKANAIAAYMAARAALDMALADRDWTAVDEQQAGYQALPPAVILDVDETVLDNLAYQALTVTSGEGFPKNWDAFVQSATSKPVPGSLDFIAYAASKGVTAFYVTNRSADQEEATRKNLAALGYPVATETDTVLMKGEKEGWGSAKGSRRAVVAATHRVLVVVGDNFGDFVDAYKGTIAERQKVFEANADKWGTKWIMLANPSYGSWEAAPFGFDYKLPDTDKRRMKRDALEPFAPPQ